VLDSPSSIDALFSLDPTMTDRQLDAALALMERRQAGRADAGAERRGEVELIQMEAPASD
jgi:hypothetical protein